ncbi:MAG: hypothetical protein ACI4R6_08455 [Lachnospiraceae bacterium]
MEKRILSYRRYMDEQIRILKECGNVGDVSELKREHLTQIGFFQHERLIHLIVTVVFALLEVLSIIIVLISGEVFSILLPLAVMVLLVPYIRHYYILENEVQKMYRQYDVLTYYTSGDNFFTEDKKFTNSY